MSCDVTYVYLKIDGQPCNSPEEADIIGEYVNFGDDGPEIPFYKVRDRDGNFREFTSSSLIDVQAQVRADKKNFNY